MSLTDEKFVFVSDVRDKKRTARGSFHKRTHAGKGGSVKFPSDFLSRKELNAMNGEVKSFNINSPMKWAEFKAMPDDIKVIYINAIREKYHTPNKMIAEMLGLHEVTFANEIRRLQLKNNGKGNGKFDGDGWCRWINGIKELGDTSALPAALPEQKSQLEELDEKNVEAVEESEPVKSAVPAYGQLDFECNANAALQMIEQILQDSCVKITVVWKRLGDGVRNG